MGLSALLALTVLFPEAQKSPSPINTNKITQFSTNQNIKSSPFLLGNATKDTTEEMVQNALAYAACNGLVMADDTNPNALVHAPFSLLPAIFPKAELDRAYELAPLFNKLVDRVADNLPWLEQTLRLAAKSDDFTGRLIKLCAKVHGEGLAQKSVLAILRSDYMLHEPHEESVQGEARGAHLLQVELNTIASSFGSLSSRVSELHRSQARCQPDVRDAMLLASGSSDKLCIDTTLPSNDALSKLAEALALGHREYCAQTGEDAALVLFIVQPGERNIADQRLLAQRLLDEYGVESIFRSLARVDYEGRLKGPERSLILEGGNSPAERHEISVAYFRAGYTPDDYPTSREWAARLLIERSRAVKCPSISYHLVGAKKVQQALSQAGELEKFVTPSEAETLRSVFAGMWSLTETEPRQPDAQMSAMDSKAAMSDAMARPEYYVLKPQREGGGNNLFGEELASALSTMSRAQKAAYVLMQRIEPRPEDAILIRSGQLYRGSAISELGVYSTYLRSASGRVVLDSAAGHLVRTKLVGVDEGGVAAGFAFLSSPLGALCDLG